MMEGDLLTVREVAQRLRVNPSTIKRWIKLGQMKAIVEERQDKKHNRWLIPEIELVRLIEL